MKKSKFYSKIKNENQMIEMGKLILTTDGVQQMLKISKYQIRIVNYINPQKDEILKENQAICGVNNRSTKTIDISVTSHINSSIAFLTETIAHEIAHIVHFNHSKEHKKFTNQIKKVIKSDLGIL